MTTREAQTDDTGTVSNGTAPSGSRAGAAPQHRRTGSLAVIVLVPVVVFVMLTLFAWPAARMAPRDLPIGVAGPAQVVGSIGLALAERDEDAFDINLYEDEAAARSAIREREIYGAIVVGPAGTTVLTASAASPVVAQLLQQAAAEMAAAAPAAPNGDPAAPRVIDVVPATADDPRGAVLGASVLPLVMAGMATAILLWQLARPGFGQALALLVIAALSGLVIVAVAQGWLNALEGDWWTNGAALALTVLATGAGVAGLGAVLGRAGIGLGAALMMLVGNPFSGITSAPELLPSVAGALGQLLPPGAGGTLLRNTAFFDGAAVERPLIVLSSWAVAGLLLVVLGRWIRRT